MPKSTQMENLKRYNQVILALLGTIGILTLLVILIYSITIFIQDFRIGSDEEISIISEEEAEELLEENLRKHLISFNNLDRIDSLNGIYLIPITQTHLEEPEDIRKNFSGMINSYDRYELPFPKYYGLYNNILIYYSKQDEIVPIYEDRVSINEIKTELINGMLLIFMKGTKVDTNKDGKLTSNDLQYLSIYNVGDRKLEEIEVNYTTYLDYERIGLKDEIILQLGLDRDTNGLFTRSSEPKILKRYNLKTKKLDDLVGKELKDKLQGILDGK